MLAALVLEQRLRDLKLLNQPRVMQINARTLETLIPMRHARSPAEGVSPSIYQSLPISDRSRDGLGAWASEDSERRRHILTLQPNLDVGSTRGWSRSSSSITRPPAPNHEPAPPASIDRSFAVAPPSASIRCPLP